MRVFLLLLLCALLSLSLAALSGLKNTNQDGEITLNMLKKQYQDSYNHLKEYLYKNALSFGPILLVTDNRLTLLMGDKEAVESQIYDPSVLYCYHIDNIAVGLYAELRQTLLQFNGSYNGTAADISRVTEYEILIPKVMAKLETWFHDNKELIEERTSLEMALNLTHKVIQNLEVKHDDLVAYAKAVGQVLHRQNDQTGYEIAKSLHAVVSDWLKSYITAEDLKVMKIIIAGPHPARYQNLYIEYFGRLLADRDADGRRMVFAENLETIPALIDYVTLHNVDTDLATQFFNDSLYLHRDFRGKGALQFIETVLDPIPQDPYVITYSQIVFYTVIVNTAICLIVIYLVSLIYLQKQYSDYVTEEKQLEKMRYVEIALKKRDQELQEISSI